MPSWGNSVRVVFLIARGRRGTSLPRVNVRKEIQRRRCWAFSMKSHLQWNLSWRINQKKRNTNGVDMYISQCVLYRNIMWWLLFICIPKSKSQYVCRWKISWLRINHFKKSFAFGFDEPYSPRLLYRSTTQESCCWRVSSSSIWASSASRSAPSTSR